YSRAQAGVAGHDQDGNVAGELDEVRTRCARQAQVADDQVIILQLVTCGSFLNGGGFINLVLIALQQLAQRGTNDGFVFNNQDFAHSLCRSSKPYPDECGALSYITSVTLPPGVCRKCTFWVNKTR